MLYLLASILCSTALGVIFKWFGRQNITNSTAIIANYLTCVVVAVLISQDWGTWLSITQKPWIYHAVGMGALFILGFNIFALAVQSSGITLSTLAQKIALVLTAFFSIIYFGESLSALKIFGILLALIAIYLLRSGSRSSYAGQKAIVYLLLTFLIGGSIEILFLYFQRTGVVLPEDTLYFTATLFASAAFFGLVEFVAQQKHRLRFKDIKAGALLGVPNFFSIYFLIRLLEVGWDGSVVFSINNTSILLLSALIGILIFNEHMTRRSFIGFGVAFIAILSLSLAA